MLKYIISILSIACALLCAQQTFAQSTFGAVIASDNISYFADAIVTSDGGSLISCLNYTTDSTGILSTGMYPLLIRLNAKGDILWAKKYIDSNDRYFGNIKELQDGGFLLSSSYPVKIDANGNIVWCLHRSDKSGVTISPLDHGGYIASSVTRHLNYNAEGSYVYTATISRLDTAFNTLWSFGLGEDTTSVISIENVSVLPTKDGGVLVSGDKFVNGDGTLATFVAKVIPPGTVIWERVDSLPDNYRARLSAPVELRDGSFIRSGGINPAATTDYASYDMFIEKFTATGKTLWVRTLDSYGEDFGASVVEMDNGDLIIGGGTREVIADGQNGIPSFGMDGALLARLSSAGNLISLKRLTVPGVSVSYSPLFRTSNGLILALGNTHIWSTGDTVKIVAVTLDPSHDGCFVSDISGHFDSIEVLRGSPFSFRAAESLQLVPVSCGMESVAVTHSDFCSLGVLSVRSVQETIQGSVFPNPNTYHSQINIQLTDQITPGEYMISLRDLLGVEVFNKQVLVSGSEQLLSFDAPYLTNGTYFVELHKQSGEVVLRSKVIVE